MITLGTLFLGKRDGQEAPNPLEHIELIEIQKKEKMEIIEYQLKHMNVLWNSETNII